MSADTQRQTYGAANKGSAKQDPHPPSAANDFPTTSNVISIPFMADQRLSHVIVAVIGFGFNWMCFFLLLFGTSFSKGLDLALFGTAPLRIAMLTGMLGASYIISRTCDIFKRPAGTSALSIGVCVLFITVALALLLQQIIRADIPLVANIALWFVAGVGIACNGLLWTQLISRLEIHVSPQCVCGSVAVGAVFFLLINSISPIIGCLFFASLPIAGLVLRRLLSNEIPLVAFGTRKETIERMPLLKSTDAFITIYGVVFGLAIYHATTLDKGMPLVDTGIVAALMLLGAIVMSIFYRHTGRHMIHGPAQRIIYPLLTIALMPMPFVDGIWYLFCLSLLLIGYICFSMVNMSSQTTMAYYGKGEPLYFVGRGRCPIIIGTLVGHMLGAGTSYASLFGVNLMPYLALGLAVVLALFISFVPFEPDRLLEKDLDIPVPHHKIGHWKARCMLICTQYKLSPRETEVFNLLARGHGTEFIQNKLFISSHTVKTHAYSIYKKLDVSSREELISLVEEVDVQKTEGDKQR
jgi:DNA-binding CsgD family transcriptional regulator